MGNMEGLIASLRILLCCMYEVKKKIAYCTIQHNKRTF